MNRNHVTLIRWTDKEFECLSQYMQRVRAPTMSAAIRSLAQVGLSRISNDIQKSEFDIQNPQFDIQMIYKSQEKEQTKESSKEKRREKEPAGGVDPASARPPAYEENLILWLTDDEALKPFAAEFLRGLTSRGIDLQQKGLDDLRRHFLSWLPKYRAKQAIAQKQVDNSRTAEPNWAKARREQQAAELQRKLDADCAASADADAAKKAFFDKFYKYKKHK
ncbi:MAG: hypothetical protein IJS49_02205 [Paludibacteraceae bacterium]|nr:hypothetical protein [Paludibacteraceae bacterium]